MDDALKMKLSTDVDNVVAAVKIAQDSYILDKEMYFQLLKTQDASDEVRKVPDTDTKPFYQIQTPKDIGLNLPALPFSVEVHQYRSPERGYVGYQTILRTLVGLDMYSKVICEGVEAKERSHDWILYAPLK